VLLIAIDTNIIVYAHRRDSEFYPKARGAIDELASGLERWAIPWPCLHEFHAVVTNFKAFMPPSTPSEALEQIGALLESPSLVLLTETERHWQVLRDMVTTTPVRGIRIHDAKIAAICLEHDVHELWTADRDFSRFPQLKTRNPLAE
jgi:toxin-antitoxin system PIN domain toxin